MKTVIAVGVSSASDRLAVAKALGPDDRVVFCSTSGQYAKYDDTGVAGVLLDVCRENGRAVATIAKQVAQKQRPLLVRVDFGADTLKQVLEIGEMVADCRVTLRAAGDLSAVVRQLVLDGPNESAALEIISHVAEVIPRALCGIIAAAIVAGEAEISVDRLAGLIGISARTLETRMREFYRALSPKRLLMWVVALHATYRISRARGNTKQAAHRAGVDSARALSNRVERATGIRLSRLRAPSSFGYLLDEFARVLAATDAKPNAVLGAISTFNSHTAADSVTIPPIL
jgi:uncharacterized membrane protein